MLPLNRVRFYCPITDTMPRLIECLTILFTRFSLFCALSKQRCDTWKKRGQKVLKTAQSLISSVPFSFFFAAASKIETCAFKWFPILKTDTKRNFCSHTISSPKFFSSKSGYYSLSHAFSVKNACYSSMVFIYLYYNYKR